MLFAGLFPDQACLLRQVVKLDFAKTQFLKRHIVGPDEAKKVHSFVIIAGQAFDNPLLELRQFLLCEFDSVPMNGRRNVFLVACRYEFAWQPFAQRANSLGKHTDSLKIDMGTLEFLHPEHQFVEFDLDSFFQKLCPQNFKARGR